MSLSNQLLDAEALAELSRLRPGARQRALRTIGEAEFARCASDPIYWLDSSRHLYPYVYTNDPKPLHECIHCHTQHHFHRRKPHLEFAHSIETDDLDVLRGHFIELSGTRPFTLHDYMRPIIHWWQRDQFVLVEKSRDMMATWMVVALYTWDTLFHSNRQNIFQSLVSAKTAELVRRSLFIYKNQPKFLRDIHKATYNVGQNRAGMLLVESLDSEILGFPQGPEEIRQYHPTGVFQDEAAYQPMAGDAFAAIKPAIQSGGRFTAISSANPGWFMLACRDRDQESV